MQYLSLVNQNLRREKLKVTASSCRRTRSSEELPLLFVIGIIAPSTDFFPPFSQGSAYLYLGRMLISASDAPSYLLIIKSVNNKDNELYD